MRLIKPFRNFTTIENTIINDKRVTPAAKGVWLFLMSRAEGWDYSVAGTASAMGVGQWQIRSAIQNLERYGYLTRTQIRKNGGFGGYIYRLIDVPASDKEEELNE